jgi:hypothetical protein
MPAALAFPSGARVRETFDEEVNHCFHAWQAMPVVRIDAFIGSSRCSGMADGHERAFAELVADYEFLRADAESQEHKLCTPLRCWR